MHAVSVGEVVAARPILKELRERLPDASIVMSSLTAGGIEMVRKYQGDLVDHSIALPVDYAPAIKNALRGVKPAALVVMETELWPNLVHLSRHYGSAVILANGRVTEKSFSRYMRWKWLFGWTLKQFDLLLVQTEGDRERFISMGALPERISVLGNSKFDQPARRLSTDEVKRLRSELRLPDTGWIVVVGSTRALEEEKLIMEAYRRLVSAAPDCCIIWAPRHIERAEELQQLFLMAGFQPGRRSAGRFETRQVILDTYGELADIYAVGDVAVIGNSLTAPGGGQNILQPLAHGKPVFFGPYMGENRDVASLAIEAEVAFQTTSERLADDVLAVLKDEERRRNIASLAIRLIDVNRGAASRYADSIVSLIKAK